MASFFAHLHPYRYAMNTATTMALKELRRNAGALEFLYPWRWAHTLAESGVEKLNLNLVDRVTSGQLPVNLAARRLRRPHGLGWKFVKKGPGITADYLELATVIAERVDEYRHSRDDKIKQEAWGLWNKAFGKRASLEETEAMERCLKNGIDDYSTLGLLIQNYGYTTGDLQCWVECIKAKTLLEALDCMEGRHWPRFLLKFTFARNCRSRVEAYRLAYLFDKVYRDIPDAGCQVHCLFNLLRTLQQHLYDFVPTVCQISLERSREKFYTTSIYNELLWQVSRFGVKLTHLEATAYSEAQRIVALDAVKRNVNIDTKGYLALAYTLRDLAPEKSSMFMEIVRNHEYDTSVEEERALGPMYQAPLRDEILPYLNGYKCMGLLSAQTEEDLMQLMGGLKETRTSVHWAMFVRRMDELGCLNSHTLATLWKKISKEKVKLTPLLVLHLVSNNQLGYILRLNILRRAKKTGCYFTRAMDTKHFQLLTKYKRGVKDEPRLIQAFSKASRDVTRWNVLLEHCSKRRRSEVWQSYQTMVDEGYEPTLDTLKILCRVCRDYPDLKWNGLYAPQRAVVEVKNWLRGVNLDGSDVGDVFKLFPDEEMFHLYILMLGRARYGPELLAVLPWMERLNFTPSMDCLCALITYSPNGEHLQKHSSIKGAAGSWPWPSDYEVEAYQHNMKMILNKY